MAYCVFGASAAPTFAGNSCTCGSCYSDTELSRNGNRARFPSESAPVPHACLPAAGVLAVRATPPHRDQMSVEIDVASRFLLLSAAWAQLPGRASCQMATIDTLGFTLKSKSCSRCAETWCENNGFDFPELGTRWNWEIQPYLPNSP